MLEFVNIELISAGEQINDGFARANGEFVALFISLQSYHWAGLLECRALSI